MTYFNSSEKNWFSESLAARLKRLDVVFTGSRGFHLQVAVAQWKLNGIIAREGIKFAAAELELYIMPFLYSLF